MTVLIIHPDIFSNGIIFQAVWPSLFHPEMSLFFYPGKTPGLHFQDTGSGSGYSGYRRLGDGVDYIDADYVEETEAGFMSWIF